MDNPETLATLGTQKNIVKRFGCNKKNITFNDIFYTILTQYNISVMRFGRNALQRKYAII